MELDRYDQQILDVLQQDGRISSQRAGDTKQMEAARKAEAPAEPPRRQRPASPERTLAEAVRKNN